MALNFRNWLTSLKKGRPPLEGAYIYILSLLIGYWISDLTLISIRPAMLPTKAPPGRPQRGRSDRALSRQDYNSIVDRNIFTLDGQIPPPLSVDGTSNGNDEVPAVLSQLPLTLQGTIVHANPIKSVATVLLKSRNLSKAFRVNEEIEGVAKVTKVERTRVTFRNLNNSRLEYIEIVSDVKINFGMNQKHDDVEARGDFDFALKRDDVKKYTADLSAVLNQARMIPNVVPGTGGRVEGFRFVNIQAGSIYEKLGFKPDDVIKGVNGESVNSPTKAMELYQTLKTDNKISLTIERNGKEETFQYTVTE